MIKSKKITVLILALIGLITSLKLTWIYIDANFNPYALPSFCSINNVIDCDSVAKTTYSQFLGIPLAIWGVCLYLFVIFLLCCEYLKKIKFLKFLEVFKHPLSYIYCITLLSFIISMCLAGISVFKIHKICILCVLTYFLDLVIALVSRSWGEPLFTDIKTSFTDFMEAVKVKSYAISLGIIVLLAAIFLTYTSLSYVFTPQVKRVKSFEYFSKMKSNPYKTSGNELGEKHAKIVIQTYTDYNCQGCYIANLMLARIVTELNDVKVIHHHLPLDADCNPFIQGRGHQNSCLMAKYAIAAEKQNKFWDMNDRLFEKMPKDEQGIIDVAREAKLNIKQLKEDAYSQETKDKLKTDIEKAEEQNINGTPTIIIGMHKSLGIMPYYELKDKLIKMGASEKK